MIVRIENLYIFSNYFLPYKITISLSYPDSGLGDHNYCRNPSSNPAGPWCFNGASIEPRWETCGIPACSGKTVVFDFILFVILPPKNSCSSPIIGSPSKSYLRSSFLYITLIVAHV